MSDLELLQHYVRHDSQAAFTTLVERYLNLVYSAARRQVHLPHLAEEIAQSVFIDLSRNAARIRADQPLAAWLFLITRRTAIDVLRREGRRQAREQAAVELAAMKTPSSAWTQLKEVLDEGMEFLNETDRTALLLRFFENRSLREVGKSLGISEDTAQKRVGRALERLRMVLLRRGVAVSTAGLASDLSAHALQNAPSGLIATISSAAVRAAPHTTLSLIAATLTMATIRKSILGTAAALMIGGSVFEGILLQSGAAELANLRRQNETTAAQSRALLQEHAAAVRRTDQALRRVAELQSIGPPAANTPLETQLAAWLKRAARLKQLREQRPELAIPELQLLDEGAWFEAAREGSLDSEADIRVKFAELRWQAEYALVEPIQRALGSYLAAHDGALPPRAADLALYFEPPIDPAILDRYEMIASGKLSALPTRGRLIAQRSPVDLERDSAWLIGLTGWTSEDALASAVKKASDEFTKSNNGARATEPFQLAPYLPAPVSDPEKLRRHLKQAP